MASLPKGMSWADYLKFVTENPRHTLSEATGAPIKGRPNAEVPKMVPPADPFANMSARAEAILARKAAQAKQAASDAKSFMTEPQRLPHPVTGLPYQTKDPVTGKLGGYAMGFTPAQTAARVGLPTAGAVGGLGYLGLKGAESRRADDSEAEARRAEELRMQQAAAADQSAFRNTPNALPFFATREEDKMRQRGADLQPVTPGLLAMAGKDLGQTNAPSFNPPNGNSLPVSMQFSNADLMRFVDPQGRVINGRPETSAPRREQPTPEVAAAPADQGILSKIFGADPYKDMSSAKLMNIANRDPDNAAAFFRADAALRKERPEMFEKKSEEGMATGGAAKPHKDAALHKALEIIHHLISRG